MATISGTPTLFLWEPSPGDAWNGLFLKRKNRMARQGDIPPGGQRN